MTVEDNGLFSGRTGYELVILRETDETAVFPQEAILCQRPGIHRRFYV